MIHVVKTMVDGEPCFETPLQEILAGLDVGWALQVLTPIEWHTERQRRWYRGVCLKGLSDWSGDTVNEWDMKLKDRCNGVELLKTETIYLGPGSSCKRLTIKGTGKRNMTAFIEGILSLAITEDWPVTPPDPELRK